MKVLVISTAPLHTNNSEGNTISNWFAGWDDVDFSCIYFREALPNSVYCRKHLSISPINVVRNIIRPYNIGKIVDGSQVPVSYSMPSTEQTVLGWKRMLVMPIIEVLYASNIWFNRKVKSFIQEAKPDIVFMFSIPDSFRYNLLKYIKSNTRAQIVQCIVDDVYGATYIERSFLNRIHRNRYHKLIKLSDKVYGISEEMCRIYSEKFGINVQPLYKGCIVATPKGYVNSPLRIVYAGNLLYGREKTLIALIDAVNTVNRGDIKIELKIFSGSMPSINLETKMSQSVGTHFCGRKPYELIKEELHNADLVLHAESFEPEQIQIVRYSFSTKIIDCLQSGSVMLVIGPKGISSVEYPKRIPGTIVIEKYEDILTTLQSIICNPHELVEMAKLQTDYAIKYHSLPEVQKSLRNDFLKLLEKE